MKRRHVCIAPNSVNHENKIRFQLKILKCIWIWWRGFKDIFLIFSVAIMQIYFLILESLKANMKDI